MAGGTRLRLELLGGFRVLTGGRTVTRAPGARQQQLVAYLVLHARQAVARQRVAGVLWPDSTDAQALTNLRRELHHLREAWPELDSLIDTAPRTLAWRGETAAVDILAFEAAAIQGLQGSRAALEEASRMYAGDLLPDCAAEWIEPDRQRLQDRARAVLARLVEVLEHDRAFGDAIERAQRLLRLDPLDEPTWCALMRCHARRGERASGQQALEYASDDTVDVLITDMMMPGMNGLELIEQLQSHPAGRPLHIILMTAYDVPGLKETTRRLNIHNTIIKPVPTERICQIVKQVLENMHQANVPEGMSGTQHFKIMIADDVPDNVNLLSRFITNEGYSYIVASNGIEVLQKAHLEMPDLILLDVNMPEKDGFTALQELRADPEIRHIPVIILTAARPAPGDIQWGLNLGADDYVTKPFDKRELLARIRTKLRVKEVEDAIRRRNRELSILPEIARELSARLDVNELLDVALRRSVETLGAIVGHVLTLHPREPLHKEYRISASGTSSSNLQTPPLEALVQQIKEKRASLIVEDTRQDARWQPGFDDSIRSALVVPMTGRSDLLGLFVMGHEQPGYFNMEHQVLLQAIASQASIAVENAQLYASLIQEEQKFTAVLHNAADAILMFDAERRLLLANPAGRRLFTDYDLKVGRCLPDGLGYDSFLRLLDQMDPSSAASLGEIEWPDKRVFSAIMTPLTEGGCVIVLHDITHFKNLERVKNEFIAAASHDLRNPIASIEGFSRLIEQAGPLNKSQEEFVKRIQNSAEGMLHLVENMLDLAKMDLGAAPSFDILNVSQLLSEIADEFQPQAQAKSQFLTLVKGRSGVTIRGDALQLRQALRNLVGNAVKYTPNGGTITLSLECEAHIAKVKVQDTGYGIPAEDLPFIFDRFYRAQYQETQDIQGNGLGLAIVKSIVERHGGQVQVESKPGVGSCFSFSMPVIQPDLPADSEIKPRTRGQ